MNNANETLSIDQGNAEAFVASPRSRPAIHVNLPMIPANMRALPQWVLWKYKWVEPSPRHPEGKWTKLPVRWIPTGNGAGVFLPASSTNPDTWMTFRDAAAVVLAMQRAGKHSVGIGFVFTDADPFFGIDLDKCRDLSTGELTAEAHQLVCTFSSYTEVSPSGTGVKIIVRGTPPGSECRVGHVEHYFTGRFFTITGDVLPGLQVEPQDRQAEVESFYRAVHPDDTPERREAHDRQRRERAAAGGIPNPNLSLSDADIIRKASQARNGDKFLRLWNGDSSGFPSGSEADLSLASTLAFWCGGDVRRIVDLMWQSGLARAKWSETRRGGTVTIIEMTVQRAVADIASTYGDGKWQGRRDPDDEITDDNWQVLAPILFPGQEGRSTIASSAEPAGTLGSNGDARTSADPASRARIAESIEATGLTGPHLRDEPNDHLPADVAQAVRSARLSTSERPDATTCHHHLFMFHPERRIGRASRVACGRWNCTRCSTRNKTIWKAHLSATIDGLRPGSILYTETIDGKAGTWDAVRKRLQRAGANHVRIQTAADEIVIVSTFPVSAASMPLTRAQSIDLVTRTIDGLLIFGDTRKPIHTSRPWKRPEEEPTGWKVVGALPRESSTTEITDAIKKLGYAPETKRPPFAFLVWAADFAVPLEYNRVADEGWQPQLREIHERLSEILMSIDGELTPEAERLLTGRFAAAG